MLRSRPLGNDGYDLSDGNFFRDYVEAPGEIAGWVGVAATSYYNEKAFYSNYGWARPTCRRRAARRATTPAFPVSGPAGLRRPGPADRRLVLDRRAQAAAGPGEQCTGPQGTPPCFLYGYVQGTSMATPNAAGVAALIISQYGDFSAKNKNKPHMSPTAVEQYLQQSANNQPCPDPKTVVQGPGFDVPTATCQGNTGYNSFFGKGIVDALKAVTLK